MEIAAEVIPVIRARYHALLSAAYATHQFIRNRFGFNAAPIIVADDATLAARPEAAHVSFCVTSAPELFELGQVKSEIERHFQSALQSCHYKLSAPIAVSLCARTDIRQAGGEEAYFAAIRAAL